MKLILFLWLLTLIFSCEGRNSKKTQSIPLSTPLHEIHENKKEGKEVGKEEACQGYPMMYIEMCRTGGYEICFAKKNANLPKKEYRCGFGDIKYKNFICASEHKFTKEEFDSIQCDWMEEKKPY